MDLILFLCLGSTAFAISIVLTRAFRGLSGAALLDLPNNRRKIHLTPVPRSGGAAICLSYLAALAMWSSQIAGPQQSEFLHLLSMILPGAVVVFGVGLLDDLVALTPWQKLAGQVTAAFIAHASGFSLAADSEVWWSLPVTVFWLLLTTNGFNLIDGLDGLAAGIGLIAVCAVLVAAGLHENVALALIVAPLLGSLLGFLPYNSSPASVFLGDSGSLFLGFVCGCATILWSRNATSMIGTIAPVLALAVPIVEVGLSVVRRTIDGRPVFQADREHIHHRLLAHGLTAGRSVALLESFAFAAGLLAVTEFYLNRRAWLVLLLTYLLLTLAGIVRLGYLDLRRTRRLVRIERAR